MRFAVIGFSVVTISCAGTPAGAPTAPSSVGVGAAVMSARGDSELPFSGRLQNGSELPFYGTLQATETATGALHRLTGEGQATHLGRFTLTSDFVVIPPPVSTASGTATWTAANGDQIFTTTNGHAVITFPIAAIVETHAVTGGTGRFAEASGSLVVDRSLNLLTLVSSASITGAISLGH